MTGPSLVPAAQPTPWRWWVCVMLLLASTLNYMDRMALNQTASLIKNALGLNNFEYGVLEAVFTVGFAIGTLTTGWLVDNKFNVRWVYPAAVTGWSLFGFLTGFAPSYWFLFACRFGLGLFEAGNWPCGIRTVRQVMPPAERSLGNSFFQNGTAIGAVVTPMIVLATITWVDPGFLAREAHLAVGGGWVAASGQFSNDVWQVPFRVIGAVGLVWVVIWLATVRGRTLRPVADDPAKAAEPPAPFVALLRDRRFWLLVAIVLSVNTSWHTFRVWLPQYLEYDEKYTFAEVQYFNMVYYLVADLGAWGIGFGTIGLVWLGVNLHRARMLLFALCAALVLVSLALPFLSRGPLLTAVLLTFGFGSFGLFTIYFTLSQELSGRHQGKVTGTTGAINALYLTAMYPAEGAIADALKRHAPEVVAEFGQYAPMMAWAGLPTLLAFVLVVTLWPKPPQTT